MSQFHIHANLVEICQPVHADANANVDAITIHTKNNMSPSPSVGDINM